ncbi:17464_t:CDS:1, partial [Dentiscutata erythropus]
MSQNFFSDSPAICIFPDNAICEEPTDLEESTLEFFVPSILDRKIERHRQRRAICERAGRLQKTSISGL